MMNIQLMKKVFNGLLMSLLVPAAFFSAPLQAGTISQVPLFVTQSAEPLVMLSMSNDHQLFYKAYDDWSDFDGDGVVDNTYKHDINSTYYGYYDPLKCYSYDASQSRFEPQAVSTTMYCDAVSGDWSGNFLNWATMARIDTVRKMLYGGDRFTDSSSDTVLERTFLPNDAHSFAKFKDSTDLNKLTPFTEATGLTICNTTVSGGRSQSSTSPPLIRVARGNHALWAANERWQCRWSEERGASNANNVGSSGINASSSNPSKAVGLGNIDYVARTQVCLPSLLGTENCKLYPAGNLKPIGLLQTYGEDGGIFFGLMTGSYGKSKSGGVLRKNAEDFSNEINVTTDGTFKTAPSSGNIIGTLNALRLYGYSYSNGHYNDSIASGGDNCRWGLNSFTDGRCSNWGNPQAEIFLETLRYLGGNSADTDFNTNDSGFLSGLPTATWVDPMPVGNYCAKMNIINFNASTISYDGDQLTGASDIGITNLTNIVNAIGDAEGITGNSFFVGENGVDNNQICTSKSVTTLDAVKGTCPDAPRLEGSYKIAGLAHHANTEDIRTDRTGDQNIGTYGVSLSPALPKLTIPASVAGTEINILPACRNSSIGGNCAIVDFKVVDLDAVNNTAKLYVNWEDSEQGGDYDQDMWGVIDIALLPAPPAIPTSIQVTTDVISQSTGYRMGFGYVISGTTQDGFHAHSGINGYVYTDPDAAITDCGGCSTGDAATNYTYTISTTSAANTLEPPLWYAAKYGGFTDASTSEDKLPSLTTEWDNDNDGTPDHYFFATNPSKLASQLSDVFNAVSKTKASAASVVANSVTLETGTHIYQAQFNSGDWTGNMTALPIQSDGSIGAPTWNSDVLLNAQNYDTGRSIITYDSTKTLGNRGTPFRWADINATQQGYLNINPVTASADARGEDRLNYLRGDSTNEEKNSGLFRSRDIVLGDIVNSTPYFVGAPAFTYADSLEGVASVTGGPLDKYLYSDFKEAQKDRMAVIYVGANDGFLHAIIADGKTDRPGDEGKELFAYAPGASFDTLNELTGTTYTHQYYLDSSPTVVDAFFSSDTSWRSVLVSGLGAGGQAVFALDVTDPSLLSETNAADIALWEFTTVDDADLGFTYSQPAIAKMANGQWAAIFGNGYGSAAGKAALYIVDLETGALIKKIDTGTGSIVDPNGLSTPAPVDINGDSIVDYIFAGDLHGNMWKFDVTDTSNLNKWTSAYKLGATLVPLFKAVDTAATPNRQPITTRPEVSLNPHGTGLFVYFGTGQYFEEGDDDPAGATMQTAYGIIDDGSPVARSDLLTQSIVFEGPVPFTDTVGNVTTFDIRVVSDNSYSNEGGWVLDLDYSGTAGLEGEKQVTEMILRDGRLIFTTLIPSTGACDAGGTGWLMELDAKDGSRLAGSVFDLNNDGQITATDLASIDLDGDGSNEDVPVSGKKSKVGIIQRPTIIGAGEIEYKYASGSQGGQIEVTTESSTDQAAGRMSWQQLR